MKYFLLYFCLIGIFIFYSCDTGNAPTNHAPKIDNLTANKSVISPMDTVFITCTAHDPDGDKLTYSWKADGGTIINGSNMQMMWIAPETYSVSVFHITCTVSDNELTVFNSIDINVRLPYTDGFNTGVDDFRIVQEPGSHEMHYYLSSQGIYTDNVLVISPVQGNDPWNWVTPPDNASWIGPSASDETDPTGTYIYTLEIDLTNYDAASVVITGDWASDNNSKIQINDKDAGFDNSNSQYPYGSLTSFKIDHGFISGINKLEFVVTNTDVNSGVNPTGLLVANLMVWAVPKKK